MEKIIEDNLPSVEEALEELKTAWEESLIAEEKFKSILKNYILLHIELIKKSFLYAYTYNGSTYKVHATLGPGLLESTYEVCLEHELLKAGLKVERQKALPVVYDDLKLDAGYRIDLLVNGQVILNSRFANHEYSKSEYGIICLFPNTVKMRSRSEIKFAIQQCRGA